MASRLTPSTLRIDLKCGKGAISEGEKCHVGPASKAETNQKSATKSAPKEGLNKTTIAAGLVYGALIGTSLYQLKNMRQAYSEKFDPATRYSPFKETLGDPSKLLNETVLSNRAAAPSLFGEVSFGTHNGKDIVIKSFGKKGIGGEVAIDQMQSNFIISDKTAAALKKGQSALQVNEVQGAELAGKYGFGPRVLAAGKARTTPLGMTVDSNVLVTEVAKGRPLSSQDRLLRQAPKLQQEFINNPGKAIEKMVALQWRGFTKGTELSNINKDRIIQTMGKMHMLGMSHNDLHPGNIFISNRGAQFIDFGTSDRGGATVASEFVRMMNPPRAGLAQNGGMGYNLRTLDPKGYQKAEKSIKAAIGKKVGSLTSADIQKALNRSKNKEELESRLQSIVDDFYTQYSKRPNMTQARKDATSTPCGNSHIPSTKTCHKSKGTSKAKAVAVGLTAGAVGAALLHKGSRQALLSSPKNIKRLAQKGINEAVYRATAKPPSMRLTPKAFENLKPPSKTQRLHLAAKTANVEAEAAIKKAAQIEVERGLVVGEAMYKAGKATRASLRSGTRRHNLTVEKLRRRYEPGYRRARRDTSVTFYPTTYVDPAVQRGDARGTGKQCGKGYTSATNKCQQPSTGGPRNYAAEIRQQDRILQANDFNSWRKANKLRKPTTQGSFDRLSKQYAQSQQGAAISAAWKRRSELKQERNRRNAGYALLGGAALGVTALALSGRRR